MEDKKVPEATFLGTEQRFDSKAGNWAAQHWESIYIVAKFIEMGAFLIIVAFVLTHW